MKTVEEAKTLLEELGRLQEEGKATGLPCPRCGRFQMDDNPVRNAMSRRADVYICDQCGMDEAMMDTTGKEPLPLNRWGMVLGFDKNDSGSDDDDGTRKMIKSEEEYRFDTHGRDSKWNRYSGSLCTVIRPLTEEEVDLFDVGPMYRIQFEDGTTTDAFEDELFSKEEYRNLDPKEKFISNGGD